MQQGATRDVKTAALVVANMASLITPFMVSSVNIALPSIGDELHMDAISLSWVATLYILSSAVFMVPLGRLADIHGRKKVFAAGIIIFTAASLLLALSRNEAMLLSFRVMQGAGVAMIFGTSTAILTSVFPPSERGKVLGINLGVVYAGLSIGPFLGGLLTEHFGWRSVFWAAVPMGIVTIVYLFWKLKGDWVGAAGQKFDLPGSVIYGLGLVGVIYGFSLLPSLSGLWVGLAGMVSVAAFAAWESRVSSPVLDVSAFRKNVVFALSNLAALINYAATYAVTFLLSLFLQYTKGLSPENAGLVLIAQPIMQATISPFAGRLSDRIEPRIVASAGMALTTLGLALLAFLQQSTALAFIVVSLAIVGLGLGLFVSPNTNAIMGSVEHHSYGVASATLGTMRMTGQMLSLGISTLILAIYVGRVEVTPQYYPAFVSSVKTAFAVFAVLCFGGTFASLARGKMR